MLLRGITCLSVLLSGLITALTDGFTDPGWLWKVPAWFAASWAGLLVLVLLYYVLICLVINTKKPQDHDSPFYRRSADQVIQLLLPLARVHIQPQGIESIPADGRFLLVCNHLSSIDPLMLLHCFPDSQLAFISKKEVQDMFLVGKLQHKLMCQPINRENDREALKTILKCIQLLKADEVSVAVFPEGRTSPDGRLCHFRSGVFKIAQKTQVPIVVCTMKNTHYLLKNLLHLRHTDIPLHLVKVISPEEYKDKTTVELGEAVYELMINDLGEDFRSTEN